MAEDVLAVDVDRALEAFTQTSSLTANTQAAYEARFRKLMATFSAWSDDPDGDRWRQIASERKPRGKDRQPRRRVQDEAAVPVQQQSAGATATMSVRTYPFQVRRGVWVELILPADLTVAEAGRLSAFVATLGLD